MHITAWSWWATIIMHNIKHYNHYVKALCLHGISISTLVAIDMRFGLETAVSATTSPPVLYSSNQAVSLANQCRVLGNGRRGRTTKIYNDRWDIGIHYYDASVNAHSRIADHDDDPLRSKKYREVRSKKYRETSNIRGTKSQHVDVLRLILRYSNYFWVINNFIAY